jgi:hypothetical protein
MAAPDPVPSHVRLNFSCNVVVVSKAEVLETYERAINAFSRPVDPEFESGVQQVRRGGRGCRGGQRAARRRRPGAGPGFVRGWRRPGAYGARSAPPPPPGPGAR